MASPKSWEDNQGDLFLDLESSPLPWGNQLKYLIGIWCRDGEFLTWWSHTLEDEQKNFEAVLDFILKRRSQFEGMHVYCYGHFEASAFRRTAERSSSEYQAKTEESACEVNFIYTNSRYLLMDVVDFVFQVTRNPSESNLKSFPINSIQVQYIH